MLAVRSPHEAYRRVDFDARVNGATPAELVHLCYDHLVSALGTAIHANKIGDNSLKSRSLTRALTSITALQLGVNGQDGVAGALHQLYEGARRTILDSALRFDSARLAQIRTDFMEIGQALRGT
ncbi:flagellar export chaperone FliS [Novosphingobium album (ex Liu et al. 2023)]|uniref:Flagellar protein FliS n=1 Tax=Novosphingobium album (ex Liu et al. 2023) TaxID=3031130 RepID=A0ABT5WM65_9SPHN|nr:flagellar protein FliS [Novosphingobium album (ex Liu et al. 2023)]MDE8651120.1 flagellar protein FliS [Novosphingobium album (ex Liu et al. 2023)]